MREDFTEAAFAAGVEGKYMGWRSFEHTNGYQRVGLPGIMRVSFINGTFDGVLLLSYYKIAGPTGSEMASVFFLNISLP